MASSWGNMDSGVVMPWSTESAAQRPTVNSGTAARVLRNFMRGRRQAVAKPVPWQPVNFFAVRAGTAFPIVMTRPQDEAAPQSTWSAYFSRLATRPPISLPTPSPRCFVTFSPPPRISGNSANCSGNSRCATSSCVIAATVTSDFGTVLSEPAADAGPLRHGVRVYFPGGKFGIAYQMSRPQDYALPEFSGGLTLFSFCGGGYSPASRPA